MKKLLYFSLSMIVISAALLSMQPHEQPTVPMVKLESNDGQIFELPKDAAELSPTLQTLLSFEQADQEEPRMAFDRIDGETLSIVVKILTELYEKISEQEAGRLPQHETIKYSFMQGNKKYEGYVTLYLQAIVDDILPQDKALDVMLVFDFLEMPALANAACKWFVIGLLEKEPTKTVRKFMARVKDLGIPEALFDYAKKYFLMQKAGILAPELSIVDYVALNGMPAVEMKHGKRVLELHSKGLTNLDGIELLPLGQMESLDLSENNLFELDLERFRVLAIVPEINLSDNKLSTLDPTTFQGFIHLRALDLSGNYLAVLNRRLFQQLTNLRELDLSDNYIAVLPPGIFNELENLNDLNLSGNQLTALDAHLLYALVFLENFSVGDNQLSALPAWMFSGLAELSSLDLSGNQFTEFEPGLFVELIGLEMLRLEQNFLAGTAEQFSQQHGLGNGVEIMWGQQKVRPVQSQSRKRARE